MALSIETWRPPGDSRSLWQILSGGGQMPEGSGWSISNYESAQLADGMGVRNVRVPVYQRIAGQPDAAVPNAGGGAQPAPRSQMAIPQPSDPVPLIPQAGLAIGGYDDPLRRPITDADRIGQGVNTESVEDFMKRYNAQLDWVRAGMDITNWSPSGMISSAGKQDLMPADMSQLSVSGSTGVTGNATGFSRKQSSARKAGLTSKGTGRLRINRTGQTSASSGLNIGV